MFRILRVAGFLVGWDVICLVMGYAVYGTMTVLLTIYLVLELVALCLEADIRMRRGLLGYDKTRGRTPRVEGVQWQDERLGLQKFYKDTKQLRKGFQPWLRWLPARVLWRLSLWSYFW